jgi:hypothetical protein
VKERKTSDRVEGDEAGHARLEDDDEDGCQHGEGLDASREDQPAAPVGELLREEAVARLERREAREVRIGRVRRHDQDEGGGRDREQIQEPSPAEDGARQLRDDRLLLGGNSPDVVARKVIPTNRVVRIAAIQRSVIPALWLRGSLKAVIPLEMASMPVRAVVPFEKAWSRRNKVTAWRGAAVSRGRIGHVAEAALQVAKNATPTVSTIMTMKK